MKNLGSLMKQAQEMQTKMQEMQDGLEDLEVTGSAGGGMVKVVITGKGTAKNVSIDPSLFSSDEAEVVEDLVTAAFNDAKAKAEAVQQEEMMKLTGGLQLPPGMKLPF